MKTIDIKYSGVPNICFSLSEENNKMEKFFKKQRLKRGFDDSELWSLYTTIGKFILPRIKRLKKMRYKTFEVNNKRLINNIDLFIKALELITRDNGAELFTKEERKTVEKGLKKFPKIFFHLFY